MGEFYIHCFIKFGGQQAIQDLYENGTVYLNPVQYFKTLEDNFRGDNYEGASYIRNYPPGQFRMKIAGKSVDEEFKYINLHLKESYEKTLGNIFSLYCLSSKILRGNDPVRIDQRVKSFGSRALLIQDNPLFLSKIEKALDKKRLHYEHRVVEYYNKHIYTGAVDIFNKPSEYAYQNEFRIYVRRRSDEPLVVRICSLKDIAEVYEASAFIDTFEATEKK